MTNTTLPSQRFNDFHAAWRYNATPGQRKGQVLMNLLRAFWPAKYEELTGTDLDCFYDDKIISKTLNYLELKWPH